MSEASLATLNKAVLPLQVLPLPLLEPEELEEIAVMAALEEIIREQELAAPEAPLEFRALAVLVTPED